MADRISEKGLRTSILTNPKVKTFTNTNITTKARTGKDAHKIWMSNLAKIKQPNVKRYTYHKIKKKLLIHII